MASALADPGIDCFVSVATLWQIAIKERLGKLDVRSKLDELDALCEAFAMSVMPVTAWHVLAPLSREPPTRDPFDRLLLVQAELEGMRLATVDRALFGHPVVWQVA